MGTSLVWYCIGECRLTVRRLFVQSVLKSTGMQGKPTVFLITDTQIKEESFLEDIDSLLNTGEVPNLFATDEKAEIMEVSCSLITDSVT